MTPIVFAALIGVLIAGGVYLLLRAHLAYRIGAHLELALRGENLLDERYQDQLGYASPGRAVYLQMAIDL